MINIHIDELRPDLPTLKSDVRFSTNAECDIFLKVHLQNFVDKNPDGKLKVTITHS